MYRVEVLMELITLGNFSFSCATLCIELKSIHLFHPYFFVCSLLFHIAVEKHIGNAIKLGCCTTINVIKFIKKNNIKEALLTQCPPTTCAWLHYGSWPLLSLLFQHEEQNLYTSCIYFIFWLPQDIWSSWARDPTELPLQQCQILNPPCWTGDWTQDSELSRHHWSCCTTVGQSCLFKAVIFGAWYGQQVVKLSLDDWSTCTSFEGMTDGHVFMPRG